MEGLKVLLHDGSRTTALWWLSGNYSDVWRHGEVTVGRIPVAFTILFEASRTFNRPGHMAIDDIDFTNCSLPGRWPAVPAHTLYFSCLLFFSSWFLKYVWFSQSPSPRVQRICLRATTVCVSGSTKCVTSAMTVGTSLMRTTVVRHHKCFKVTKYVKNTEYFIYLIVYLAGIMHINEQLKQ